MSYSLYLRERSKSKQVYGYQANRRMNKSACLLCKSLILRLFLGSNPHCFIAFRNILQKGTSYALQLEESYWIAYLLWSTAMPSMVYIQRKGPETKALSLICGQSMQREEGRGADIKNRPCKKCFRRAGGNRKKSFFA
ncbi:hypothetical protein HR10_08185 [Porphyromonas gulae]|uniref:Uncharacterized protein n=1 Tax=Porphyromonas gulae TaxID=111105 RepID=A0A0A2F4N6_9PORP|nr:hypothetical protein HR15_08440 [Porphyromonas gulae]KKC50614.1 hypothetical protein HR10_08185 [Porphyromonas gulae]